MVKRNRRFSGKNWVSERKKKISVYFFIILLMNKMRCHQEQNAFELNKLTIQLCELGCIVWNQGCFTISSVSCALMHTWLLFFVQASINTGALRSWSLDNSKETWTILEAWIIVSLKLVGIRRVHLDILDNKIETQIC